MVQYLCVTLIVIQSPQGQESKGGRKRKSVVLSVALTGRTPSPLVPPPPPPPLPPSQRSTSASPLEAVEPWAVAVMVPLEGYSCQLPPQGRQLVKEGRGRQRRIISLSFCAEWTKNAASGENENGKVSAYKGGLAA